MEINPETTFVKAKASVAVSDSEDDQGARTEPRAEGLRGDGEYTAWEAVLAKLLIKGVDKGKLQKFADINMTLDEVRCFAVTLPGTLAHLDKVHPVNMDRVSLLSVTPHLMSAVLSTEAAKLVTVYGADFHLWCLAHGYITLELGANKQLVFRFGDIFYDVPQDGFVNEKAAAEFLASLSLLSGKKFALRTCGKTISMAAYTFAAHVRVVPKGKSLDNMEGAYNPPYLSVAALPGITEINSRMAVYVNSLKNLVAKAPRRPESSVPPVEWFCKVVFDNQLEGDVPKHPYLDDPFSILATVPYEWPIVDPETHLPVAPDFKEAKERIAAFELLLGKSRIYRNPLKWNDYTHDLCSPTTLFGKREKEMQVMKFAEAVGVLVKNGDWVPTDPVLVVGDPRAFDPIIEAYKLTPSRRICVGHDFKGLEKWESVAVTSYFTDECKAQIIASGSGSWIIQAATFGISSAPAGTEKVKGSEYKANRGLIELITSVSNAKGFLLQVFADREFAIRGYDDLKGALGSHAKLLVHKPWREHNNDFVFSFCMRNVTSDSRQVFADELGRIGFYLAIARRFNDIRNLMIGLGLPGVPKSYKGATLCSSFPKTTLGDSVATVMKVALSRIEVSPLGKQTTKLAPIPDQNLFKDVHAKTQLDLEGFIPPKGPVVPPKPVKTPTKPKPAAETLGSKKSSGKEEEEGEVIISEEEVEPEPLERKSKGKKTKEKKGKTTTKKPSKAKMTLGTSLADAILVKPPGKRGGRKGVETPADSDGERGKASSPDKRAHSGTDEETSKSKEKDMKKGRKS